MLLPAMVAGSANRMMLSCPAVRLRQLGLVLIGIAAILQASAAIADENDANANKATSKNTANNASNDAEQPAAPEPSAPEPSAPEQSDPEQTNSEDGDSQQPQKETAGAESGQPAGKAPSSGQQAKKGLGRLPWTQGREEIRPSRVRLPSPRKMLDVGFEIGASQLALLYDGQPFQTDDEETLLRILFAIRRFRPDDIASWERKVEDWAPFTADPESMRTEIFELKGRVKSFEKRELLPEVKRLFQVDHYYLVSLQSDAPQADVKLCCLQIPESWKKAESLSERVEAAGMFLKTGEQKDDRRELIFATPRIAWRPDEATEIDSVTQGETFLAELGVDISLFEGVRNRNGRKMGAEDREPFYQVLAAAPQASAEQLSQIARPFSLTDAIQKPKPMQAGVFTVRGRARRITRVLVGESETDIRERFGIDHYYMIDFFIPLGDLTLQLSGKKGEAASPIYQNGFPAIACVRSLPPELQEVNKRLVEGRSGEELLNEEIELTGVFYRLWAFKSEYVDAFDSKQRQISPMFLATSPKMITRPDANNPYMGAGVAVLFLLALGAIWFSVWRAGKSDTAFEKETLHKNRQTPAGQSLNDLGIEADNEPDFSNLD